LKGGGIEFANNAPATYFVNATRFVNNFAAYMGHLAFFEIDTKANVVGQDRLWTVENSDFVCAGLLPIISGSIYCVHASSLLFILGLCKLSLFSKILFSYFLAFVVTNRLIDHARLGGVR
jgi:hypothetical protein